MLFEGEGISSSLPTYLAMTRREMGVCLRTSCVADSDARLLRPLCMVYRLQGLSLVPKAMSRSCVFRVTFDADLSLLVALLVVPLAVSLEESLEVPLFP